MSRDMHVESNPSTSNGTQQHKTGLSPVSHKNGYSNSPANGHSSPNGTSSSHTNGVSSSLTKSRPSTFYGHDREEVTRLLIQGLGDLGYESSATALSQESGYAVESPTVAAFRRSILQGEWSEAQALLFRSDSTPDGGGVSLSDGKSPHLQRIRFVEGADEAYMKFKIREQKYLECLEKQDTSGALLVLQTELQPLHWDKNWDRSRLNTLSELLVCNPEDLFFQAHWDGADGHSREKLLEELSRSISPSVMIPSHRLVQLLDQVKQNQIRNCLYHNPSTPLSLFTDHMCDRNQFPLRTTEILDQSDGEVWFVEFSHNGKYLATCGASNYVFIYDTTTWEVRHLLKGHTDSVPYFTWSLDDTKLITCCKDHQARVWDTSTGRNIVNVDHNSQPVTTAAWAPNGRTFVTGSLDKEDQLCHWDLAGRSLHHWVLDSRIQDMAISNDGRKLVVVSAVTMDVVVFDFETREKEYTFSVQSKMTCVSISRDSRYMLISTADSEVHLYDIETAEIIRKYSGKQQGEFIIRSAFGGSDENMVISGSEDSKIYIWHKENGTLIEELSGHLSGCVNAVSWNPANPGMFASGGDDRKVRIWTKEPEPFVARRISSHASTRQNQ